MNHFTNGAASCEKCGRDTKMDGSRKPEGRFSYRRYAFPCGHCTVTVEMPAAFIEDSMYLLAKLSQLWPDDALVSGIRWSDLQEFVDCYNADNRHEREESDRFHSLTYNELVARDKPSLDIFWLEDESLEDSENLPAPEVLALEIAENLEAALAQFTSMAEELSDGLSSELADELADARGDDTR